MKSFRCGLVLVGLLTLSSHAGAQIVRDGSIGPPGGPLTGPNYLIDSTLGEIKGPNLFHSFSQFNLNTINTPGGSTIETATFTNSQPSGLTNVISRVTGGQASSINGGIISQIPGASLYLVNPSGFVFGRNASLNVSGSFYVSTANYLRFIDGAKFYASLSPASTLSSAPVAAFGFLGPTAAPITVDRSRIAVSEGQTLALIGGDTQMQGDPFFTGFLDIPTLAAPGGRIVLASVASAGEVVLNLPGLSSSITMDGFTQLGQINLVKDARIDTSSKNGNGTVVIRSGRVIVANRSFIFSDVLGNVDGAPLGIDLVANQDLIVSGGGRITSENDFNTTGSAGDVRIRAGSVEVTGFAVVDGQARASLIGSRLFPGSTGKGALVDIQTGSLTMTNGGQISTSTAGSGPPGNIQIKTSNLQVANGGQITTTTQGNGQGGILQIEVAGPVTISGAGSGLFSESTGQFVFTGSAGNGGTITLQARSIQLENAAAISAATFSAGNAGNIEVIAGDTLTLTTGAAMLASTVGEGAAGSITARAKTISMSEGAGIFSLTEGAGSGGVITLQGTELVRIQGSADAPSGISSASSAAGAAGAIAISAAAIELTGATLNSSTSGSGQAGTIHLDGSTVSIRDSTVLTTRTSGIGRGGNVSLKSTGLLEVDDSLVFANTIGDGDAGVVTLEGATVMVKGGATISSATLGLGGVRAHGDAGTVTISATDSVSLSGTAANGFSTSIVSTSQASDGKAGRITISAPNILVEDRANISTSNSDGGPAGDILLNGKLVTVRGLAALNSSTDSPTAGGTITVTASESVSISGPVLPDGQRTFVTTVTLGGGDAGQIVIAAPTIAIDGAGILATTRGSGRGGNIQMTGRMVTIGGGAQVTGATFADGKGGLVAIEASESLLVSGSSTSVSSSALGTVAGSGDAGEVLLISPNVSITDGGFVTAFTDGPGQGGGVRIEAGQFTVTGGGLVDSSSFGSGSGGTVTITATQGITVIGGDPQGQSSITSLATGVGQAGQVVLTTPSLLVDGGKISTTTIGVGNAGSITVNAGQVNITANGILSSSGTSTATGSAGSVTIQGFGGGGSSANAVTLASGSVQTRADGDGAGGSITVRTASLNLNNGSTISASANGIGNAGALQLADVGTFTSTDSTITTTAVNGRGGTIAIGSQTSSSFSLTNSTISATVSGGSQPGGDIALSSGQQIQLINTSIAAESNGLGNAGNISLAAGDSILLSGSTVTAQAALASGGIISLTAPNIIQLTNSTLSTSVQGGVQTVGGNILIDPQFVILQNSQIIAKAIQGQGGNIQITAGVFLADYLSVVDASSQFGVSGTVTINSPIQNLSGTLAPLNQAYLAAAGLLRERCAVRAQSSLISSFVVRGRDGLPAVPGSAMPSPLTPLPPVTNPVRVLQRSVNPQQERGNAPALLAAVDRPEQGSCQP